MVSSFLASAGKSGFVYSAIRTAAENTIFGSKRLPGIHEQL